VFVSIGITIRVNIEKKQRTITLVLLLQVPHIT